jgi:hypothetical protein
MPDDGGSLKFCREKEVTTLWRKRDYGVWGKDLKKECSQVIDERKEKIEEVTTFDPQALKFLKLPVG